MLKNEEIDFVQKYNFDKQQFGLEEQKLTKNYLKQKSVKNQNWPKIILNQINFD